MLENRAFYETLPCNSLFYSDVIQGFLIAIQYSSFHLK